MNKFPIASVFCLALALAATPAMAADPAPASSAAPATMAMPPLPPGALTPKEVGDKIAKKYVILAYNAMTGSSQPIDITMPDMTLSMKAGKFAASPDCLLAVATQVGFVYKATEDAQLLSAAMAAAQCVQQKFEGKAVVALFKQSAFGTTGRPESAPIWSGG